MLGRLILHTRCHTHNRAEAASNCAAQFAHALSNQRSSTATFFLTKLPIRSLLTTYAIWGWLAGAI